MVWLLFDKTGAFITTATSSAIPWITFARARRFQVVKFWSLVGFRVWGVLGVLGGGPTVLFIGWVFGLSRFFRAYFGGRIQGSNSGKLALNPKSTLKPKALNPKARSPTLTPGHPHPKQSQKVRHPLPGHTNPSAAAAI